MEQAHVNVKDFDTISRRLRGVVDTIFVERGNRLLLNYVTSNKNDVENKADVLGLPQRACSAGLKPAGWLVFPLTESLFTSCQNSIFLSQQSAGTVFFSPAEQAKCVVFHVWSSYAGPMQTVRRDFSAFFTETRC